MRFITTISLLLVSFLTSAQPSIIRNDSTQLYAKIEAYSKQTKFKSFVYKLIFKSSTKKAVSTKKREKVKLKSFKNSEGKIIRHISIVTLDPFGFSVSDSSVSGQSILSKTGNSLHVKSQRVTIRNLLLIHQNQKFDSLLVKESERLVRSQSYVHDVSFVEVLTSDNSDSVDILIRELDNWSIAPSFSISSSSITTNVIDRNFMGMGHAFTNNFTMYNFNNDAAYFANYYIPNVINSFVNITLHYGTDKYKYFTKSVALDRPFISPFTRWAAGITFNQQYQKDSIHIPDLVYIPREYTFNSQDYWFGYAMPLFKGNTVKDRTTNLITAIRFFRIHFLKKPLDVVDPQHYYSNEHFYLAGIGISTRQYVQDSYIFKYAVTEDVPIGKIIGLTGGYQFKNDKRRLYLGTRFSVGNYHSWGYLSTNLEGATFVNQKHLEQEIMCGSLNYFTHIKEIGTWKFRQFVKPEITIGLHRFLYDSLTLNDGFGLEGFNSKILSGISRILLTFQTQSYAPWNVIGFRFGPYFTYSLGMLSNTSNSFINSKIYSQFGLGILIKNENLILNNFQISIAFYPIIPGIGNNLFKLNVFKTTDIGFDNFELGKPETILFQ